MNKTISYKYKKNIFQLNVSTPYSDMLQLAINNVVCSCVSQKDFLYKPDSIIQRAIKRYLIEKSLHLI
jgi:hypothetical protein